MDFGISTLFFHRQKLTVDKLEVLRKAGYRRIELYSVQPHLDFHDRGLQRAIGNWFHETAMAVPLLHLPYVEYPGTRDMCWVSPIDSERRNRELALDKIKRSLELGEYINPAFLVMHLGIPGQAFNPAVFEYTYTAIARIRAFSGVDVLIENIANDISTPDRVREFKSAAQLPEVGVCYDIGHGCLQPGKEGNIDG
jgi:sugar phosphate isomerase/epimerase